MTKTLEALGHFLFDRQARTYTNDSAYIEEMWGRWEVREFWLDEAQAILGFLMPGADQ